jgi:signal transduction histidine kinase
VTPPPAAEAGAEQSLRSTVNVALVITALVLVLSVAGGAASVAALLSTRTGLIDEIDPALTETTRLRAAVADQLGGVRGYSLTLDPDFIEPWRVGRAAEQEAVAELRVLLSERASSRRLLQELVAELRQWHEQHALPLIENADAGIESPPEAFLESRAQFQVVRAGIDGLIEDLAGQREAVRERLDDATGRMIVTLVTVAISLVALMIFVGVGLRRSVLRPLDTMAEDARRIAAGEFDRVPAVPAPQELAEVSRALDQLRSELVTQLRAGEEREADLARSNAELEQFAYVASHDLQEPLRKVASFCQMLQRRYEGQLDERADTYIEFAVDGAKRMQELISDLLAFSRVGRTTERFVPVDLGVALDMALRNLGGAVEESAAEVVRGEMPVVMGDRSLLVALFQNLIGNAIKFRSDGHPVVSIEARQDGPEWEFTVADNGIGIPDEYRDRVFVIFQRLHGRDEYSGTGIGLALCRKIVEFHGGSIGVEDHDGPGTTIRFTLQQDPVPLPAARPSPQGAPSE